MSVFDEILCKLNEVSNSYVRTLNDDIKVAFDCLDKFAEEYQYGRGKKDQSQKKALVNTLMSIHEDEDENSPKDVGNSKDGTEKRLSNKRSKEQVDGMLSPEQEKRPKRNASVKAQNNITKQRVQPLEPLNQNILLLSDEEDVVNVSLTQKLRRDDTDKSRRRKDDDKENALPIVQVKLEKMSLPPEPMETEAVLEVPAIPVKQEPSKDKASMPPPAVPVPKPQRLPPKEKSTDSEEEEPGKRRTRTRNNADMPPPPEPGRLPKEKSTDSEEEKAGKRRTRTRNNADMPPPPARAPAPAAAERAARRARKQSDNVEPPPPPPPPEPRPKRTRAKKKVSESSTTDTENTQPPLENGIGSPAEKPRPKRTRRGQKAAEKEETPKPKEPTPEPEIIIPKQERISIPDTQSPAIPQKTMKKTKTDTTISSDDSMQSKKGSKKKAAKSKAQEAISLEETQVIKPMDTTVTISMDKTVVLTNGVYDHMDGKTTIAMNETVVLDKINRDTMVLDKPQAKIMDSTVVIDKDAAAPELTADLSLLTDDDSEREGCSPHKDDKLQEPSSAVKAKVQQFEEMAARTTRTKTRAMAKKDAATEKSTPPDKMTPTPALSADTLSKMNNMIFNGKTTLISSSASKPVAKLPPVKTLPASASKAAAISQAREEQRQHDARTKKEAMLEAKKEMQKRKREEKMAAAAAAREAADRERRAALQAQARDRMEKQAHADQGKLERMKEAERKKQELARKVAETEERRRAEEQARLARLADEQRKADAARKRQQEDSEAMKKEAAMMAKEIEKRQKEYIEKQKMKQRMEDKMHTPLKTGGKPPPMEPVYMADGFQHLNSDDDDDDDDAPRKFPTPAWCKSRHRQLALQHLLAPGLVDRLFSVRVHSVDLRAIFPHVERAALKRTSSAVWRTPPALHLSRVHESPV